MLNEKVSDGEETATPPDAARAALKLVPVRPTFMGLANTLMGAPAPDEGGVSYAVAGIMPSSGVTLLGAEEGTGKSLVAISLATAFALEDPAKKVWCDYQVIATGGTLMVLAEGKEAMHKERGPAILRNTFHLKPDGPTYAACMNRIELFSMRSRMKPLKQAHKDDGIGRRLFYIPHGSNSGEYRPTPMLLAIFDHVRAVNAWADAADRPNDRIRLIVFDTLQALFGVKLIDDEAINDVMQYLNIELDELGCVGLVLAHTNKSSTAEDDDPRSSIKGSQQVMATVESVLLLRSQTEAEWQSTRAAGIDMPRHKALAIRPGKFNNRDADKQTKLLMGLPDGAPIGITEQVGHEANGTKSARGRGSFTVDQIHHAVGQLFIRMWRGEGDPRISINKLYEASRDEGWRKALPALAYVTTETSPVKTGCKVGDAMRKAEADGKVRSEKVGNGRFYHPIPEAWIDDE